MTRYPTYCQDSLLESAFEAYTERHYESWVAFAHHKQYGRDIQPILVSGVDMTRDFAMVAYSNANTSPGFNSIVAVPMFASAPTTFRGTWRTRCSPHTNHGPQQRDPPLREGAIYLSPLQWEDQGNVTSGFNQCVFIRYYTMRIRKRMAIFFKARPIRAGAGPHDLGPGDNRGDTFPELTAQSSTESTTSGNEDLEGQPDSTTDDDDSEADSVIRNTYVCFPPCPPPPPLISGSG